MTCGSNYFGAVVVVVAHGGFDLARIALSIPSSREGENKGPLCCRNALPESPQS